MKINIILAVVIMQVSSSVFSDESLAPVFKGDPHRNELGFFDMHVCNWPDRPLFFKSLFSTTKYKDIVSMEVFSPDGVKIIDLNLKDFMRLKRKGKPDKRVFLQDSDIPQGSKSGWYEIVVTTRDGKEYRAKDYVVMSRIERAGGLIPADGAEDIQIPKELSWSPIPGASHYKVFLRDAFEDTLVLRTKLLQEPRVELEPGLLKPGGYYTWKIHARDVNENIILGDFNSGSVNSKAEFSVKEE